jgi:peptide-methionine (S)-S-oxide reductase
MGYGSSVGGTPRKEHEMRENAETAILAGGCFRIIQQLLRDRDGVISTRVGFIGGENENPSLENNVGHAEAVEVAFDPDRLSYRELLEYFFMVHRPDLGEDVVGTGYRSEIFHASEEQRVVAEETIRDVDASGHWPGRVVTRVSEAGRFWEEPPRNRTTSSAFRSAARRPSRGRASRLRLPEPRTVHQRPPVRFTEDGRDPNW